MKTTTLGIVTILAAVINAAMSYLATGAFDVATTTTGVAAGWGLLHAKDSK